MFRGTRFIVTPLLYGIALLLPFAVEHADEFVAHFPASVRARFERLNLKYQTWTAGPRTLEARYTALIKFTDRSLPSVLDESCKQRELVQRLLPQLADSGVSLIVIDVAFLKGNCPESPGNSDTAQLIQALSATAERVAIVLSQTSASLDELPEEDALKARNHGMAPNAVLLRPLIPVPNMSANSAVLIGLARLNDDISRVPLEWLTYEQQNGVLVDSGPRPSIALQAARVYRSAFPDGTRDLDQLTAHGLHPFTRFLPMRKLLSIDAADLLCGTGFEAGGKLVCNGVENQSGWRQKLRGKIAILGWDGVPKETWQTPVGPMPGIAIHANFIESLLDSHYLKPISYTWQVIASLIWFILIEVTFYLWPERAYVPAMLLMMTVSFLVYYVAVVNLGYYLALLPPSFCVLLLRFWQHWFERQHGHVANQTSGATRLRSEKAGTPNRLSSDRKLLKEKS